MSIGGRIRAGAAYVELSVNDSRLVRGLRAAQRHLQNFGRASTALGRNLFMLGGAAAAPFAGAIRVMTGFSDQMAQVRAITGANASDFAALESKAKELGSSTSFSARQVAEAMQFLGMAGFDTQQILSGIPDVLNLARAGAIGLGEAADIASDVGSAFGLSADQIGRVADVMAKTASSANTSIAMMGETMKYAAPLAAAAGQSIEDTATAVGVLGNSGIKASMAGTDLAIILKSMGNSARKGLAQVGVQSVDAAGNIRSVVDVMRELGHATAGMSDAQRLKFFEDNFNRAAKSALILSKAGGGMTDLQQKINGAGGSANEMAAVMEDTMGGSFRAFKSAVEGAAIAIGEALAPTIKDWTERLSRLVKWLQMAGGKNQGFIVSVAKTVAIVAAVGAGLVVLGTLASSLGAIFGTVAATIGGVGTALGTILGLFAAIFSPIGIVTAAVLSLGFAFGNFGKIGSTVLDWIMEKFGSLAEDATAVFGGIRDALASGNFELAAKILWMGLRLQWFKGLAFLKKAWANFGLKFMEIGTNAFYGVAAVLNNVWSGMEKGWLKTTHFFADAWAAFSSFVVRNWNKVSGFFKKAWAGVKGFVTGTDSSAAIKKIEEETIKANLKIEAETNAKILAREGKRKAGLARIDDERKSTNQYFFNKADERNRKRKAASDKAVADAEAAVTKAKADLAKSLEEAQNPKPTGDDDDDGPKPNPNKIPRVEELTNASSNGIMQIEEKAGANVGAALGTDDATKAIQEALRSNAYSPEAETAKHTKAIAGAAKQIHKEQEETNRHLAKNRVGVKRA